MFPKKTPAKAPESTDAPIDEVVEQESAPEAEVEVADEPQVDEIAELNAKLIPMRHPDGDGACDRYEQDKAGNILVPASEAALMAEHGFVVVDDA